MPKGDQLTTIKRKRPLNPFFLYKKDVYHKFKSIYPNIENSNQLCKIISESWKALSEAEKAPYTTKGKLLGDEFKAESKRLKELENKNPKKRPTGPKSCGRANIKSGDYLFVTEDFNLNSEWFQNSRLGDFCNDNLHVSNGWIADGWCGDQLFTDQKQDCTITINSPQIQLQSSTPKLTKNPNLTLNTDFDPDFHLKLPNFGWTPSLSALSIHRFQNPFS